MRNWKRFIGVLTLVAIAIAAIPAQATGPSATLELKVLEWLTKQTAFGTAPSTLFVALHSADPGDTCASELSGTGSYARAQLNPDTNNSTNTNWNAVDEPATAKRVTNKLDITFPTASASWNSGSAIQFFSILDASTSGTCLWSGAVSGGGVVVLNGNTLKFTGGTPGQLAATLD